MEQASIEKQDEGKLIKEVDKNKIQIINFSVENEEYGLSIKEVHEVIRLSVITELPKTPSYIKGVINLRGDVIPVLDLRDRFSLPKVEYNSYTRLIIVNVKNKKVGMIVDKVSKVLYVEEAHKDALDISSYKAKDYVSSIAIYENKFIVLINPEKLLSFDDEDEELA